jgi:head-tail adaptor
MVRYTTTLRENDRVTIRNRIHNIRFIDNIEFANKWLRIDVDGGVAA